MDCAQHGYLLEVCTTTYESYHTLIQVSTACKVGMYFKFTIGLVRLYVYLSFTTISKSKMMEGT